MHPKDFTADPQQALEQPVVFAKTVDHCPQCAELEEERRELSAENRRLWKENGELKEKCARLEHLDQRSYPAAGQAKSA